MIETKPFYHMSHGAQKCDLMFCIGAWVGFIIMEVTYLLIARIS